MSIRFSPEVWMVRLAYHPNMTMKERGKLREAERANLKAVGYKESYDFKTEWQAKAMAAKIDKACGVKLVVSKGFYMSF